MRTRRQISRDTSGFLERNRRRTKAFWTAPAIFTVLMTAANTVSWLLGSAMATWVSDAGLELLLPFGPNTGLSWSHVPYLPVSLVVHALAMIVPVFVVCLVFLFPIRLAEGGSLISRPGFWRIFVCLICAVGGFADFKIFELTVTLDENWEQTLNVAPYGAPIAIIFCLLHATAGYAGATWLVSAAGLSDQKQVEAF